jgi:hypothetical protein
MNVESIAALVDAFGGITPDERHAIALEACRRRDAYAVIGDPRSLAWADVYAIVGAAAIAATDAEKRAEYEEGLRLARDRDRRHGLDERGELASA